jgi:3-hydroxyisobutyrate dehydrogenase-like beta-hydroxyacid dehydrogenase
MAGQMLGFIGIGRMGGAMSGWLLDAGHSLCIVDTIPEMVTPLAARGAKLARSAAEVASPDEAVSSACRSRHTRRQSNER